MIVISATEPPPFGPWFGLALAVVCLASGFLLVRQINRAIDRVPRKRSVARPRWWRVRAVGFQGANMVPLAPLAFCSGLAVIGYAAFLWTGINVVGVTGGVCGIAATGFALWGILDYFIPRSWRREWRREYKL